MKKTTFICLLAFNFSLLSCNFDDSYNEVNTVENTQVQINNPLAKPSRTDLAFITQQLTNSYKANFNDSDIPLTQKINLLDSATVYVPLFAEIKPVNFAVPDVEDIQVFLNNYNTAYTNLNVSVDVRDYLDLIVQTEVADYNLLLQSIETDLYLNTYEKHNLQFIVIYMQDTVNAVYGGPKDESWKKRNIVAAVKGFETSNANAVFNVALLSIVN